MLFPFAPFAERGKLILSFSESKCIIGSDARTGKSEVKNPCHQSKEQYDEGQGFKSRQAFDIKETSFLFHGVRLCVKILRSFLLRREFKGEAARLGNLNYFFTSSKAIFSFSTFTFSVPNMPRKGFSTAFSTIAFTDSSLMPRASATRFTCT